MRRFGLWAAATVAAFAVAPTAASAAVVSIESGLQVIGGPERNEIGLATGGLGVVIADNAGMALPPGLPPEVCRQDAPTVVTCVLEGLRVKAGGGDDVVNGSGLAHAVGISGEAGNDAIVGSNVNTPGTPDGDQLIGGAGNDVVRAGGGDDLPTGGPGDDVVEGGDGNDRLDNIHEGDGPLAGDAGSDRLDGGAGNDQVNATKGRDRALGGAGDDNLVLMDFVAETAARNTRGRALADCGSGTDRALVGGFDTLAACEVLQVGVTCVRYPCRARLVLEQVRGPRRIRLLSRTGTATGRFPSILARLPARFLAARRLVTLAHADILSGPRRGTTDFYGYFDLTFVRSL